MSDRRRRAAIVVAIAVLLLGPTMFVVTRGESGSAAFGDVESVGRNRVAAATLDIAVGSRTAPIRISNIAPGDTAAGVVELANAGSLPLSYTVEVVATAPEAGPWLTWRFVFPGAGGSCPSATVWRTNPPLALEVSGTAVASGHSVLARGRPDDVAPRRLDVGDAELVCIAATLALDAPNDLQLTTIDLELEAHAEQIADAIGGAVDVDADIAITPELERDQ